MAPPVKLAMMKATLLTPLIMAAMLMPALAEDKKAAKKGFRYEGEKAPKK